MAIDYLMRLGLKRKVADRLLALYEMGPAVPLSLALKAVPRKPGPVPGDGITHRTRHSFDIERDAVDCNDPESLLLGSEHSKVDDGERSDVSPAKKWSEHRRFTERVHKNVDNFRRRIEAAPPHPHVTVSENSVIVGPVRLADLPCAGGRLELLSTPFWPPYDEVELAGPPCTCSEFWELQIPSSGDDESSPARPSKKDDAPVPPHRHCKVCGMTAEQGDPAVRKLVRFHPITNVPDFHGWFCFKHFDEALEGIPDPPWQGMFDAAGGGDEEGEE